VEADDRRVGLTRTLGTVCVVASLGILAIDVLGSAPRPAVGFLALGLMLLGVGARIEAAVRSRRRPDS
jgi:hypothetical protein